MSHSEDENPNTTPSSSTIYRSAVTERVAGPSASPAGASRGEGLAAAGLARWYVVGIGANLGDRAATIGRACEAMAALRATRLGQRSRLRETAPVGGPAQGAYLNGAALLRSELAPGALLSELLAIERAEGRERRERWGPRTLDLDLLFSPALVLHEEGLTLPHPRLHERRFALEPLVEVAPWACEPVSGLLYSRLLDELEALPATPYRC